MSTKQTPIHRLLEEMDQKSLDCYDPCERALWHLLKRHENRLPKLDGYFHKAFQQVDVTDDGNTDMAIWNLLSRSTVFWDLFDKYTLKKKLKKNRREIKR